MVRRRKSTGGAPSARKLLINASEPEESRIAVLRQGRLEEFYIERQSLGSTLGNIYKAKVTNVEKSIGAAFVDFGHGKHGFLHVSDLCMEAVHKDAALLLAGVQAAREVAHDEDTVELPALEGTPAEGDDGGTTADLDDAEVDDEPDDDADGEESGVDGAADGDGGVPSWAAAGPGSEDAADGDPLDVAAGPEGTDELGGPARADDDEGEDDASEAASGAGDGLGGGDGEQESGLSASGALSAPPADSPSQGATTPQPSVGGNLLLFGPLSEPAERLRSGSEAPRGPAASRDAQGGRGRRGRRGRRGGRNGGGRGDGGWDRRDARQAPPPIEQVLEKGQEVVVQVIKDGIGTKGPTLTTYLSIPGRFLVLMPGIRKRGVSRKVTDGGERDRLKDVVRQLKAPDDLGFVVRTAGSGATLEDLQRDLDYLLKLWHLMKSRTRSYSAPVLLYQENDLVLRTLRDLYDGQGEIVTDDAPTAEKAKEFLQQILPDCVDRVQLYQSEKPLFTHYALEAELHRLLQSRIELKSGGSLIIEQTEALVAIDVNSGRFKPENHKNIDETAFLVNSEAAVEVARQIRLRDLGGVVVVDFIDMRLEKHRKAVERIFKDELRRDRARIKVARFSPFGIIEMTRQRVRPSLKRTVHQRCPYCDGTGYVPSDETSCLGVIRRVRENIWRPGSVLLVTVRPEVAEAVLNTQKKLLAELESASRKQIFVRSDHRLAYEDIEVRPMVTLPDEFDHRRA